MFLFIFDLSVLCYLILSNISDKNNEVHCFCSGTENEKLGVKVTSDKAGAVCFDRVGYSGWG